MALKDGIVRCNGNLGGLAHCCLPAGNVSPACCPLACSLLPAACCLAAASASFCHDPAAADSASKSKQNTMALKDEQGPKPHEKVPNVSFEILEKKLLLPAAARRTGSGGCCC